MADRCPLVRLKKREADAARRLTRNLDGRAAATRLGLNSPVTYYKALAQFPVQRLTREAILAALSRDRDDEPR